MARQVAARLAGDDYQHLFAWMHVLELLMPKRRVAKVVVEDEAAGSADDVTLLREDGAIFLPRTKVTSAACSRSGSAHGNRSRLPTHYDQSRSISLAIGGGLTLTSSRPSSKADATD